MALISTEALVLRGHKLGETSRIVVLLTRERGKLRAVARGARGRRPRYRSALEPLSGGPFKKFLAALHAIKSDFP